MSTGASPGTRRLHARAAGRRRPDWSAASRRGRSRAAARAERVAPRARAPVARVDVHKIARARCPIRVASPGSPRRRARARVPEFAPSCHERASPPNPCSREPAVAIRRARGGRVAPAPPSRSAPMDAAPPAPPNSRAVDCRRIRLRLPEGRDREVSRLTVAADGRVGRAPAGAVRLTRARGMRALSARRDRAAGARPPGNPRRGRRRRRAPSAATRAIERRRLRAIARERCNPDACAPTARFVLRATRGGSGQALPRRAAHRLRRPGQERLAARSSSTGHPAGAARLLVRRAATREASASARPTRPRDARAARDVPRFVAALGPHARACSGQPAAAARRSSRRSTSQQPSRSNTRVLPPRERAVGVDEGDVRVAGVEVGTDDDGAARAAVLETYVDDHQGRRRLCWTRPRAVRSFDVPIALARSPALARREGSISVAARVEAEADRGRTLARLLHAVTQVEQAAERRDHIVVTTSTS